MPDVVLTHVRWEDWNGWMFAPLADGKVDDWRSWVAELNGPRKAEFEEMNSRYELTEHRAYLQPMPDGSSAVLVIYEGPGADTFLPPSWHPTMSSISGSSRMSPNCTGWTAVVPCRSWRSA